MRRIPPLLLLALLLLLAQAALAAPQQALQQERRVALVIGNSGYKEQYFGPLPNPANDARDMAESLKAIGFELVGDRALTDVATKAELDQAVRRFGEMIRGGGVGVFFYAGHGVQVDGKNYLIPVGADVAAKAQIKYELVDADYVLDEMAESSTKVNLVILDACRNNPFAGRGLRAVTPGLATVLAPKGTLIAYSTAPGKTAADGTGKNSPFTESLARHLKSPGQRIEDVFINVGVEVEKATGGEQSPWQSNSLRGIFCLSGTCGQQQASLAPSASMAAVASPAPALAIPSVQPKLAPPPTPEETKLIEAMREESGTAGIERVFKLARPLAAKGSIYGKYALSWKKDERERHQAIVLAANQGVPLAMVYLADFLADNPSPDDAEVANAWLRKAIELGEPYAKYRLGKMLIEGKGSPKDAPAGERLLAEAARERSFYYHHVGRYYFEAAGRALPKAEADAKGLAYLKRAIELGDTGAMLSLAVEHRIGEHVPKDETECIRLLTLAANMGEVNSMIILGRTYLGKDPAKSVFWLKKSAELGDPEARLFLGFLYRSGEGVPKDLPQALSLFRGLAEEDDYSGKRELAAMYEQGLGVPKDFAQAYFWYVVADEGGSPDASEERKNLAKQLTPRQRTTIEAKAAKWKPKKTKNDQ